MSPENIPSVPNPSQNVEGEHFPRLLTPSREYAWMLGVLSGGGSVDTEKGSISTTSDNISLIEKFNAYGEHVLNKNSSIEERSFHRPHKKQSYRVKFMNTDYAREIGDMRRENWQNNLLQNHKWIFEREFTWAFLEGYFEKKGYIFTKPPARVLFRTDFLDTAVFLSDLLVSVGIENPILAKDRTRKQGLQGVVFYRTEDLKLFSANINATNQTDQLERLRQPEFQKQERKDKFDLEAALKEWQTIVNILGHLPSRREVIQLKQSGLTRWSSYFYSRRFGDGSFPKARQVLSELTGTNSLLQEQVLNEWLSIVDMLGREPSSGEIDRMKKQGQTKWSACFYKRRFGKGKFSIAKQTMSEMLKQGNQK